MVTWEYVLHSSSWRLWCAGHVAKSGTGTEERQVQGKRNLNASEQKEIKGFITMKISKAAFARGIEPTDYTMYPNSHCLLQYAINSSFIYQIFKLIIAFLES